MKIPSLKRTWLIVSLLCLGWFSAVSQPVYNMMNATVNDCKGTLTASNLGAISGHYDHNENYTFTICIPGAQSITLSFLAFCTEANYDLLRIFDGQDTFATQLGPAYSGNSIPPTTVSTGQYMTLNFISDANVTCTGWLANWTTRIDEPILPDMSLAGAMPTCSTSTITVNFSQKIHCDSILAGAFSINGQLLNSVTSATPVNCLNDSTTSATLNFTPGLDESGYYIVTYSSFFRDQCDSVWTLITDDTLIVNDCPLEVDLRTLNSTICEGECTDIFAEPGGGDFLTYRYTWSNGLPNSAGPHSVCPVVTTTYYVTLNDGAGSAAAMDSLQIIVLPKPSMPAPVVVCESSPPITLPAATPAGGSWSGPGITSASLGIFDPSIAGGGFHTVQYTGPNGCPGDLSVSVTPIDAGLPVAACPGSPPFLMPNASPPGGTWGGPNVSLFGTFTPPAAPGIFTLGYTVNGCTDSTLVYVDTISYTPVDTVCESLDPFNFTFWPPGGFWAGNGITNPRSGRFSASQAGLGSHTISYRIFGCDKFFDVYVKEIDAGRNLNACPLQPSFTLPSAIPAGGVWSGTGIIDPMLGVYDPRVQNINRNDTLTYTIDGCDAEIVVFVRQTVIGRDSLEFCLGDPAISLNFANVRRNPGNGNWSGAGITDPNFPGEFDPTVAGSGFHTLLYIANTCSANMTMVVHPYSLLGDTSVCEGSSAFPVRTTVPGGRWSGPSIDPVSGLFNPVTAGVGTHRIYYEPPTGCFDSMNITVYVPVVPSIGNLDVIYCYKDTLVNLNGMPGGGTFTGPGVVGSVFNPALAGPGQHIIRYSIGEGPCERSTIAVTNVGPPMEVQVGFPSDTICPGDFVTIWASASGGATGNFTYTWYPGALDGAFQPVNPGVTTNYSVVVSDGCTQEVTGQVTIVVSPDFTLDFISSDPICYGDTGFATAVILGTSSYRIEWNTFPPFFGNTIVSTTGFNYQVTVTDEVSGCQKSGSTEIESYPFVRAKFLANPNGDCVRLDDPRFEFIDLSTGGVTGVWDFGDSSYREYVPGSYVTHTYAEKGTYTVRLYLSNEGSCTDTFELEVCVIPEESWFHVPNAFSPNGDLINDIFLPKGLGILTYSLRVFDRWGVLIFESNDPSIGWDGTYKGASAPEGVYVYVIRGSINSNSAANNYGPVVIQEEGTLTLIR